MKTIDPDLRALSRRWGIVDAYVDQSGTERRETSDRSRIAILEAMGVDRQAPPAPPPALRPVVVLSEHDSSFEEIRAAGPWKLRLRTEDGTTRTRDGEGPGNVDLGPLGVGYHDLELELAEGTTCRQRRIVTPDRCPSVLEVTGRPRAFGVTAQLYAIRSRKNWGIGDTGDIDELARRAAKWGASFVGLNPLHALRDRGIAVSPYSPISRLFGNWIYIDVAAVPEHDGAVPDEVERMRAASLVDYDRVVSTKRPALRRAFERFVAKGSQARRDAFAAHRERGGRELEDFATFSVMTDDERVRHPRPDAPGVTELRQERSDDIDFECWLQFELDRQLERSARMARASGLAIGLYQDLAIGCAGDSSDVWAHPGLFVRTVSIGAPPDGYSAEGQNWGLPPMNPHRLREDGYRYWSTLLRRAFSQGGALRMDHVIGLFRQFWIPEGMTGHDGAYVEFPAEDLLRVLALEATRAGAVVVGEDLGTVPEEVPGVLARFGVMSSRVLYFEMTDHEFNPSREYVTNALTTANTHDMAPIAGWLEGTDIAARERVGILDAEGAEKARTERRDDVAALKRRLEEDLGERVEDDTLARSVHAFLAKTPSALVGVSLDDLTGEKEPMNVPGATPAQYPSWTRRYAVTLDDLDVAPELLPKR